MSVEFRSKTHQFGTKVERGFAHFSRPSGTDTPKYTPVEIDTTPFEHDGILYIKIQVGRGDAAGTFELFDSDTDLTTDRSPDEAAGGTGHIFHGFKRRQLFKLEATSLDSKAGSTNTFHADIYVVQEGQES